MAQVSALGGCVVDALLLLNFGERAAHLAARERRLAARRERAPRAERRLTEKKSDAAAEAELRAEAAAAAYAAFDEMPTEAVVATADAGMDAGMLSLSLPPPFSQIHPSSGSMSSSS